MKAIRISLNELMKIGKQQEIDRDSNGAIKSYRAIIGKDPLHVQAYNRLMIVYHRQKKYKMEIAIIKKALQAYEKDVQQDLLAWKSENSTSAALSHNLAKALGLFDDNGFPIFEEPQIMRWRKRLANLERKIKPENDPRKKKKVR